MSLTTTTFLYLVELDTLKKDYTPVFLLYNTILNIARINKIVDDINNIIADVNILLFMTYTTIYTYNS